MPTQKRIFPFSIGNKTINIPPQESASQTGKKSSNVGPIVGGVIGGVGGFILLILLGIYAWRKLRSGRGSSSDRGATPEPYPYKVEKTPHSGNFIVPIQDDTTQYLPQPVTSRRSKARDLGHVVSQPIRPTTAVPPSNTTSSSGPTSSSDLQSHQEAPASPSTQEIQNLRRDMENLRQAMQSLHMGDMVAPPTYEHVQGHS